MILGREAFRFKVKDFLEARRLCGSSHVSCSTKL